jgi:hypothetical protein|tara:strand:- start:1471 stop:1644 length:174 start_codon:yes stop_codon:yes gene_type:complete
MDKITDWVKDRLPERTTWDGATLIAVCGGVILFGGIAKLLAWAGLAWGIYTMVRKEG